MCEGGKKMKRQIILVLIVMCLTLVSSVTNAQGKYSFDFGVKTFYTNDSLEFATFLGQLKKLDRQVPQITITQTDIKGEQSLEYMVMYTDYTIKGIHTFEFIRIVADDVTKLTTFRENNPSYKILVYEHPEVINYDGEIITVYLAEFAR